MRVVKDRPRWPKAGFSVLLGWIILIPLTQSLVDAGVGALVQLPASASLSYPVMFFFAAIRGASIALGQSIVLMPWHFKARWWILITAIAWAIGALVAIAIRPLLWFRSDLFLSGILILPLTAAAIAQSFYLRRAINHAGSWVIANLAAGLVAAVVVSASNYRVFSDLGIWMAWIVTGTALIWLLRHPLPLDVPADANMAGPDGT